MPGGERDAALHGGHNVNKKRPNNLATSARQRLLNRSRERGEDFNLTLVRYGTERLLYRITKSPYADRFVLKGAVLIAQWMGDTYRATRDVDLMGFGNSSEEDLTRIFRELCQIDVESDGLVFDPDSVEVEGIRGTQEYGGQRVKMHAKLTEAIIPLQVDVGFGDAISPDGNEIRLGAMLDFPAPVMRAYPPETVVAEKFEAIVSLGFPNSRLKDFYDLWTMCRRLDFQGRAVARAIAKTFRRRQTEIPKATPMGLSEEFASDTSKRSQWRGFLRRHKLPEDVTLEEVVEDVRAFLMPPADALVESNCFEKTWLAGGPWGGRGLRAED